MSPDTSTSTIRRNELNGSGQPVTSKSAAFSDTEY